MDQLVLMFGGPDMTGKTNIAKELSLRMNVPYFKSSDEGRTFLDNQDRFIMDLRYDDKRMEDFILKKGNSVIFDRGYPCEWVYSRFFSRKTDEAALRYVDDVHSRIGTKLIVTYRSSYDNIVDDLNPEIAGSKLKEIEGLYREFSTWTRCNCHFVNVDSSDLNQEIRDIRNFLNR